MHRHCKAAGDGVGTTVRRHAIHRSHRSRRKGGTRGRRADHRHVAAAAAGGRHVVTDRHVCAGHHHNVARTVDHRQVGVYHGHRLAAGVAVAASVGNQRGLSDELRADAVGHDAGRGDDHVGRDAGRGEHVGAAGRSHRQIKGPGAPAQYRFVRRAGCNQAQAGVYMNPGRMANGQHRRRGHPNASGIGVGVVLLGDWVENEDLRPARRRATE